MPRVLARLLRLVVRVVVGFYALVVLGLLYLRVLPPLTTTVHIQRRIESWFAPGDYDKRWDWTPLDSISRHAQHAVVAAEDARFYLHDGFDWKEIGVVVEEARREGEPSRGASTLTQQLVKNLFLTTHANVVRKGLEISITPLAELILPKRRILELYLNVVEWGHGIYGIEAASRHYYHIPASRLGREQAARLAAVLPAPRRRSPYRMGRYAGIILRRMEQMGW
jgi:monofunctional biosynthetic peptidoglycan transglycosylase